MRWRDEPDEEGYAVRSPVTVRTRHTCPRVEPSSGYERGFSRIS
ncbi:MAG TPA: hypothetical protein PLL54_05500 [Dermatophilaceae bacterium]|nr:hypothetical protein [Dermatophilaceae bacterium]